MMPDESNHKTLLDLSVSYLPTIKVAGICLIVFSIAWWARGLQGAVEQTALDVASTALDVAAIRNTIGTSVSDAAAERRAMGQRLDDLARELRLLRDYTEGRIGSLPYRGGGD